MKHTTYDPKEFKKCHIQMIKMKMKKRTDNNKIESPYFSPKQVAHRWQCSRSTVDRIAQKAGFSRLCLGDGKNSPIRYVKEEVIAYENTRLISTH